MNATATSLSAAPSMSRRTLVLGAGAAAAAGILALDAAPAVAQGAEVPQTTATGSFVGKKGNVDVRIVMEGDRLADIIVSSHETPGLGTAALEQLRDLILAGQTLNVDSMSGATLSSFALVNAVGEALDGAGFSAAEWEGRAKAERVRTQELPAEVDVLVVGSGAAGMCAAIEAAEAGATVAVFEKLGVPGGNSIISGAGYAAPGTWAQRQQGVEDSPEVMAQDMLAGGDYEGDPELVKVVCEGAAPAIEWLVYKNHVEWGASNMYEGGHTVAREGGPNGRGEAIMTKLFARAEQLGVALATDVKVDELVRDDSGKVCGAPSTTPPTERPTGARTASARRATASRWPRLPGRSSPTWRSSRCTPPAALLTARCSAPARFAVAAMRCWSTRKASALLRSSSAATW